MTKPTTIPEDDQTALDIMAEGHFPSKVEYMADLIAIINEEINSGNTKRREDIRKTQPRNI